MKISVELTFTPLQDDYEQPIKSFIKKLRTSGLKVIENPLSTQVYGEYEELMPFLQKVIRDAFLHIDNGLLHMKLVKSDRSAYEPDF